MSFTFGTVITNILFSSILIATIAILLKYNKFITRGTIKIYLLSTLLCIIRLLLPVEFFFAKTIKVPHVLPDLYSALKINVPGSSISIMNIAVTIWLGVALLKGTGVLRKYIRFRSIINIVPDIVSQRVADILSQEGIKPGRLRVICIDSFSPSIIGLIKPVIILPNIDLSDRELFYILKHEIQHYKHHDLWLKALSELISVLYWWNPLTRLVGKQINSITEIDNDLTLIHCFNPIQEAEYLQSLLKMAKKTGNSSAGFSLAFNENNASQLKQRFYAILNKDKTNILGRLVTLLIPAALLISYFFIFEASFPAPTQYFTIDDIHDQPILSNDGQYYVIMDGEPIYLLSPDDITP